MIDVLEDAARRSDPHDESFERGNYGQAELPIVRDLIEEDMVRGRVEHLYGNYQIGLEDITLKGRQLRDELLEKRKAKSLRSKLKKAGLLVLGWVVGVITPVIVEYLKAKTIHPH